MEQKFGDAVAVQRNGEFWLVVVGNATTQTEAETLAASVQTERSGLPFGVRRSIRAITLAL